MNMYFTDATKMLINSNDINILKIYQYPIIHLLFVYETFADITELCSLLIKLLWIMHVPQISNAIFSFVLRMFTGTAFYFHGLL